MESPFYLSIQQPCGYYEILQHGHPRWWSGTCGRHIVSCRAETIHGSPVRVKYRPPGPMTATTITSTSIYFYPAQLFLYFVFWFPLNFSLFHLSFLVLIFQIIFAHFGSTFINLSDVHTWPTHATLLVYRCTVPFYCALCVVVVIPYYSFVHNVVWFYSLLVLFWFFFGIIFSRIAILTSYFFGECLACAQANNSNNYLA